MDGRVGAVIPWALQEEGDMVLPGVEEVVVAVEVMMIISEAVGGT